MAMAIVVFAATVAMRASADSADHFSLLQTRSALQSLSNVTGCSSQQTSLNDDGGGNIVYLDRHNQQCPSGTVMTQWHLSRGGTSNQIRIDFNCCPIPTELGSCSQQSTPLNGDGGGKQYYLDRHHPDCKAHGGTHNSVMTQWHLSRGGTHGQMQIQYTCCDVPTGLDSCEALETAMNGDGGGNSVYLDRHNLACPNKVMTKWHLTRGGTHGQIKFKYNCCSVTPTPAPTPAPTPTPTTPEQEGLEGDELETEVEDEQVNRHECQKWCYSKKHKNKPWGQKCVWYACSTCPEC